jgi:Ca-activated chloride channel family protein
MTVKLRYKEPEGGPSRLLTTVLEVSETVWQDMDDDFRFACAVAGFGMLLRDSEHKGKASYDMVIELAKGALGRDEEGYRHEFVRLVEKASLMSR